MLIDLNEIIRKHFHTAITINQGRKANHAFVINRIWFYFYKFFLCFIKIKRFILPPTWQKPPRSIYHLAIHDAEEKEHSNRAEAQEPIVRRYKEKIMFVTPKVARDIQSIEGGENDVHPWHGHFVVIDYVVDDLRHPGHGHTKYDIGFTKVEFCYVKER